MLPVLLLRRCCCLGDTLVLLFFSPPPPPPAAVAVAAGLSKARANIRLASDLAGVVAAFPPAAFPAALYDDTFSASSCSSSISFGTSIQAVRTLVAVSSVSPMLPHMRFRRLVVLRPPPPSSDFSGKFSNPFSFPVIEVSFLLFVCLLLLFLLLPSSVWMYADRPELSSMLLTCPILIIFYYWSVFCFCCFCACF